MANHYVVEAGDHKYRLQGGPIDDHAVSTEALAAVGRVAASWARMEQHIDLILIHINKAQHSDEILDLYSPRHPGTFDQKIKLFKRYFNRHPGLEKFKAPAIDAAIGLKRLAEDRNALIHGIVEDYNPHSQEITINVTKYRPKDEVFVSISDVWPIRRLHAHADIVNMAHNQLCDVSRKLFSTDAVQQLQRSKLPTRPWWRRLLDHYRGQ